ncbi:MAG: hypothetical protein IKN57_01565 [Parasporobacterium sp.]|nr:hypothetical protein [Parasporobacterium sp.]
MKKRNMIAAAGLSAAMMFCPAAGSAAEEAESTAVSEQEEERDWRTELKDWLKEGGAILSDILDEGGEKLNDILGEGGVIQNALPDKEQISAALDSARDVLSGAEVKIGDTVEGLLAAMRDEDGSFSLNAIKENIEEAFSGFGDIDLLDFEGLFAVYQNSHAAAMDYYKEFNASRIDPGDVQIISLGIMNDIDTSKTDSKVIRCCIQHNFKEDEEHQLHLTGAAEDVILFTMTIGEEDAVTVKEAVFAEKDEEDYDNAMIEDFCAQTDEDVDECLSDIIFTREYNVVSDLIEYMKDHPEIKGIEYEGEIRDYDALSRILSDHLDKMVDLFGTEEMTEEEMTAAE